MPEDRKPSLTPQQLTNLLNKLDDVMAEAARLRIQVTRELAKQRASQQQNVSPAAGRPRTRR